MLRVSKKLSTSPLVQTKDAVACWKSAGGNHAAGRRTIHTTLPRAQQYGSESSGSAAGTLFKVVGVTGVIVGMPLAYAAYDKKFRVTVEGYAPFLKPVLDKIEPLFPSSSSPVAAAPPKSESSKPKYEPPSAPLSFTPPKPAAAAKPVEKRDVSLASEPKREEKPVVNGNNGSKSPTVPLPVIEKPNDASAPVKADTVDKIVQVGTPAAAKDVREKGDLKKEVPAVVAPVKPASADTKVQAVDKVGREVKGKSNSSRLVDLESFLNGRQLTAEEERLVEAVVRSTSGRLQAEFDDFIEDLEMEHEWDLQTQLKRQIAAHAGTILDALKRQEGELESHFQARLQRRLDEERQRFNLQVAGALGRVHGIEEALSQRSRAEKLNQKSQYLWHASHALYDAVTYGNLAAHNSEERMVPLSKYVTLAKVFSDSHPFVLSILRAVPEEALNRGVLSEETLRERFSAVKQSARRVAMITDQENSPFRYLLSYLQSLLIRDIQYDLKKTAELDSSALDTFRLLATAQQCVAQGDLATAVRLVGQLQGESRKVAQDWLKEARLHLETQQIAKLLLAHASAVGLSNVPVDAAKKQ
ncbi:MICOS complex subunit MIC60 [Hypsibius exemplaris]|uniref:MICOS complex subunit MIC60 n=1 Tax=Hypsibius exemplaris TaxID=2072580 RepID=A0A9X6NJD8_HYPEX|nr:MICOS complex subunit MIC60 [Hypsibius exemplaris]